MYMYIPGNKGHIRPVSNARCPLLGPAPGNLARVGASALKNKRAPGPPSPEQITVQQYSGTL